MMPRRLYALYNSSTSTLYLYYTVNLLNRHTNAGVGMVLKEAKLPTGDTLLMVKTLAPGAPAISSGMISPGDYLLTVDGHKVSSSEEATKYILGERGSSITMQFERDGERFVVAMRRGTAATLKK